LKYLILILSLKTIICAVTHPICGDAQPVSASEIEKGHFLTDNSRRFFKKINFDQKQLRATSGNAASKVMQVL
jgi:hypothetical protein